MRIGFFIGEFDPITVEMKNAVCQLIGKSTLDKLYLMPEEDIGSYHDRIEMLKIAFAENDNIGIIGYDEFDFLCEKKEEGEAFVFFAESDEKAKKLTKTNHFKKTDRDEILILSEFPYIIKENIKDEISRIGFSERLMPEINDHIESNFLYDSDKAIPERKKIIEYLLDNLPKERIAHILSVEREAYRMAESLRFDEERKKELRLAALCHDLTRYESNERHLEIIGKKEKLSDEDIKIFAGYHAISGSILAKELFGLPEYSCESIRYHTTARENMTCEDKILWLSDFIEEEREHLACRKMRARYYELKGKHSPEEALDIAYFEALGESLAYLERKKKTVHPLSYKAYEDIKRKVKKYGFT